MTPIVEVVPNFSEGRDRSFAEAVADAFAAAGADVLDLSLDPDHNRSVVTAIGAPGAVVEGSVAAARIARDRVDLRKHEGVHPRIGALDVLPFVPLEGMTTSEAVDLARSVASQIAGLGLPVYFYGQASEPPGRGLADLRRGGFERLSHPDDPRRADLPGRAPGEQAPAFPRVHPTAGATCVGVRPVLLAWNVDVSGVALEDLAAIAATLRETGGGFQGLRALALDLPRQGRMQISMNLEDPEQTNPMAVFSALEAEVLRHHGQVVETEVIGMLPDALSGPEVPARIRLRDPGEHRVLSRRVAAHRSAVSRTPAKRIER